MTVLDGIVKWLVELPKWIVATISLILILSCTMIPIFLPSILSALDLGNWYHVVLFLMLIINFVVALLALPGWIMKYLFTKMNYWQGLTIGLFIISIIDGTLLFVILKSSLSNYLIQTSIVYMVSVLILVPQIVKNLRDIFEPSPSK